MNSNSNIVEDLDVVATFEIGPARGISPLAEMVSYPGRVSIAGEWKSVTASQQVIARAYFYAAAVGGRQRWTPPKVDRAFGIDILVSKQEELDDVAKAVELLRVPARVVAIICGKVRMTDHTEAGGGSAIQTLRRALEAEPGDGGRSIGAR